MKTAIAKTLPKNVSLDTNIFGNERPMLKLSFMSKRLENFVVQLLVDYFDRNNLVCISQCAYRPLHSTVTQLL